MSRQAFIVSKTVVPHLQNAASTLAEGAAGYAGENKAIVTSMLFVGAGGGLVYNFYWDETKAIVGTIGDTVTQVTDAVKSAGNAVGIGIMLLGVGYVVTQTNVLSTVPAVITAMSVPKERKKRRRNT